MKIINYDNPIYSLSENVNGSKEKIKISKKESVSFYI